MEYIIQAEQNGEFVGYFSAETVEDIVRIASRLPGMDLKIQTVGYAIETIHHPHKSGIIRDILNQTMVVAPIDCPFTVTLHCWEGNANEAVIRWTFKYLIQMFQIDTISVSVLENNGRKYEVLVVRKQ